MAWIEHHWQHITPVSVLLYPLSLLYGAVTAARRAAYRVGMLESARLPVPIVVVGNLSVGGTGKTPLTLWLAAFLGARGRKPGIVCRGYGGRASAPRPVGADSDPLECGDEAVLLAQRSGCAVWAGTDRAATARALLAAQPGCDVLLSDDGLQHYALARDAEICVIDAGRGFGNGWLLPAGPLREPPSRLARVDGVVINGQPARAADTLTARLPAGIPRFNMAIEGSVFRHVRHPEHRVDAGHFRGKRAHALAGIGDPRRFFAHLEALGIAFTSHAFPDHHAYTADALSFAGASPVVMTEKDAVKCRQFANERHWVLRVDAEIDPALGDRVLQKLERRA